MLYRVVFKNDRNERCMHQILPFSDYSRASMFAEEKYKNGGEAFVEMKPDDNLDFGWKIFEKFC